MLVMLHDTSLTLEGLVLGFVAGSRGLLGQHSRPRDTQQAVTTCLPCLDCWHRCNRRTAAAAAAATAAQQAEGSRQ
jgi:hypothetical protein